MSYSLKTALALALVLPLLSLQALSFQSQITPVVALSGGWAITSDLGESDYFTYGFSQYQYDADSQTQVRGIFGVLLGLEWAFHERYALQSALAYYHIAPFSAEGKLTQGVSLQGSTPFDYHYQISSQQLMIENKLLFNIHHQYYPYFLIGLGAAFNNQEDYDIAYPANLIFTPFYDDNQNTNFTYSAGFGLDYRIDEQIRLGISYRFSDLGKAALGQKSIDPINPVPLSGTLEQSHLYIQQVLFQLTFGS